MNQDIPKVTDPYTFLSLKLIGQESLTKIHSVNFAKLMKCSQNTKNLCSPPVKYFHWPTSEAAASSADQTLGNITARAITITAIARFICMDLCPYIVL